VLLILQLEFAVYVHCCKLQLLRTWQAKMQCTCCNKWTVQKNLSLISGSCCQVGHDFAYEKTWMWQTFWLRILTEFALSP